MVRSQAADGAPLWRVAVNIYNNSRGQPKRGGPPTWDLGEVLTTANRTKRILLRNVHTE
jgi:hypothetical protein